MSSPSFETGLAVSESPIDEVRGTRDWLPADFAHLASIERRLLERFARAGYLPIRTPILEPIELHERKSGAGIVSKLFEITTSPQARLCLRPELTASIVRAYVAARQAPPLPWRVSCSGPVFRLERETGDRQLREFTQTGVELLGTPGPEADAEVISLAHDSARDAGLANPHIRIGHVGLILELFERSGLPPAARAALVEILSESAAGGQGVQSLEASLDQLDGWLRAGRADADEIVPAVGEAGAGGVDRLFRHLVPDVAGRREGHEILNRLRKKWELAHSLTDAVARVRDQIHELASSRGPARRVAEGVAATLGEFAPVAVASLRELIAALEQRGIDSDRVELDLGYGRGIGFYSQMIFELVALTPHGPVDVCGGGRYDGLARVLGSDRDDRGVGFAFGLERLAQAVEPPRGGGEAPAAGGRP